MKISQTYLLNPSLLVFLSLLSPLLPYCFWNNGEGGETAVFTALVERLDGNNTRERGHYECGGRDVAGCGRKQGGGPLVSMGRQYTQACRLK